MIVFRLLHIIANFQKRDANRILFKGRKFVVFEEQLIFERDGEIVITKIDNSNADYTEEEYKQLPEGAPVELIMGKLITVLSPTNEHQQASINLSMFLNAHVKKNKLGIVRSAPMDVYFDTSNIYQPDLMFISNERKNIVEKFIKGAPDFIVEILSPGSKKMDLGEKLKVYEKFDVLEYWIINVEKKSLSIYLNKNGKMLVSKKFEKSGQVKSCIVKDFSFELQEIFED